MATTTKTTDKNINTNQQELIKWIAAGAGLYLAANSLYKEFAKFHLRGKVVLITGGARGLGLVIARELARKGARIVICSRSTEQLVRAQEELEKYNVDVMSMTVDITEQEEVDEMIKQIITHFGRIDVLINNAGIIQVGPAETMTFNDYENAMRTNFWGALYCIHGVLPHFMKQGGGRIANITSIGGKIAIPHLLPYTASKFALTGFSEGLHAEMKKHNIHVTTIIPNLMRTGSPMNVTVKGDHEAEYAWFKVSDSSPLLSQKAENAAKDIIRAIEYGEAEAILTFSARLATFVQGVAPSWVGSILSFANKFLPDNKEGGKTPKKGYESESRLSQGLFSSLSNQAAVRNNEL